MALFSFNPRQPDETPQHAGVPRSRRWLFWAVAFQLAAATVVASGEAPRTPVLVELFTSEGCSDCPPADVLLARLDAEQFVPGAEAIVLSEHVTYWNHLGWRDPFSLDSVTERQQRYAWQLRLDSPYTPQAVVDGTGQFVGSDQRALVQAMTRAAVLPKPELRIDSPQWSGGAATFSVLFSSGAFGANTTLTAALADDSDQSSVAHGENAGHTLRHVAVVRQIDDLGSPQSGRPLRIKVPGMATVNSRSVPQLAGPSTIKPLPMRLVVLVTDRASGRVLAVTQRTMPPNP